MMVAHMLPERELRGPGCDERCELIKALLPGVLGRSELLLHDAAAHEEYGWATAGILGHRADVVVTGPLAIDIRRMETTLDGAPLALTPAELRLLVVLARRVGAFVPWEPLIADGLGWGAAQEDAGNARHALRVNMARLRLRLGDAAGLVVTVCGLGYRLELIEAGQAAPQRTVPRGGPRRRTVGWSNLYAACITCSTTERAHKAHGLCRRCDNRRRRASGRRRKDTAL